jgi:hypothetical protein
VLNKIGVFKVIHEGKLVEFSDLTKMNDYIDDVVFEQESDVEDIIYSGSPEGLEFNYTK